MTYKEVEEYAKEQDIEILMFESPKYKNAILGISHDNRAIYDLELMIQDLMKSDNISYEEALEFIEYNTIRALSYYDNSPIILMQK